MTIAKPFRNEPLLNSSRFTILRELGAGAFGVVYEAEDNRRSTRVALKMLRNLDGHSLYSFKREFRSLAEFTHPNLVGLHELFSENGQWFFTMDLVDGTDFVSFVRSMPLSEQLPHASPQEALTTTVDAVEETRLLDTVPEEDPNAPWVDEKKRLAFAKTGNAPKREKQLEAPRWTRLRSVLAQLAQGLCALHAAGKLHRDLKPSNVLVTHAGQLVIVDFGLATDITPDTQRSAERVAGTPAYMAPEQAMGEKAAPASDWYAVGIMLYESLTGRLPFQGNPEQILFSKQVEDPIRPTQLVRGVPSDLADLALELIKRSPGARPSGLDVLRKVTGTLPELIARVPHAPGTLVGRKEHLMALRDAFDWVRAGHAMTVHVRGKPGMGKSVLVRHFLKTLNQEQDVVILAGRCHEREAMPYKGIDSLIDASSRYLARLPKDEIEALVPPDVQALAQLFPVLERVAVIAEKIRRLPLLTDSAELRQRAFAAFRELFVRIAKIKPLVLHLDDLQWGDADSAEMLEYLLHGPQPPALLLLLSYRSNDAERSEMLQNMPAPNLLTTTQKNAASIQDIFIGPLPELDAFSVAPDDRDALAFQPTVNSDPPSAILQNNGIEPSPVEPGTVIKHYEIIRKLGAGGMGAVYLARDTRLGRRVAIKFLLDYSGSAA